MARSIGVTVVVLGLWACGGPTTPDAGAPADAGSAADAGTIDAGSAGDAGTDAGDAGLDAGRPDGGSDAGADAGIDAGFDAGFDAGPPPTGCRTNSQCASGLCLPSGHCKNCQADTECADGGVCGTGVCSAPCGDGGVACGGGATCCSGRCVDTARDPSHCSGCATACTSTQFCGRGACVEATFGQLCQQPLSTALLDGVSDDDAATQALNAALVAQCTPTVTASVAGQTDAGLLRAADGEPLVVGELLVAGGGSFRQQAVRWLENTNNAQVRDVSTSTQAMYALQDGGLVTNEPMSTFTTTRDRLIIQLVRAPSGALVLNAAGLNGPGTRAAAEYFVGQLLPNRANLTTRWYVVDWTDNDGTPGPSAGDAYAVINSGP